MEKTERIPKYLLDKIKEQYGEELTKLIIDGYTKKRKVTLRVNTIKTNIKNICDVLNKNNIKYEKTILYEDALIILDTDESQIRKLNIYENGEIYLQSLSSMLPPIILEPKQKKDILDMAAAPGGKTTQIAALTENNANITACEINKLRAERLKYNLEKQGVSSASVIITDARKLDDFFSFDQILLDAPCSGSGTISLEDEEKNIVFTKEFADKLEKTQTNLLNKAINLLKKGSEMVYSTCSILYEENESIIQKMLNDKKVEVIPIKLNGLEQIQTLPSKIEGTICVCPNELYEGFFVAKLKKI